MVDRNPWSVRKQNQDLPSEGRSHREKIRPGASVRKTRSEHRRHKRRRVGDGQFPWISAEVAGQDCGLMQDRCILAAKWDERWFVHLLSGYRKGLRRG